MNERKKSKPEFNVQRIYLGKYWVSVWYESAYPDEYRSAKQLYICEKCLVYMKSKSLFLQHIRQCDCNYPRGELVYQDSTCQVYQVDGKTEKLYCQNLCLLSKLFLNQKTLFYDISNFLFYTLFQKTDKNQHSHSHHQTNNTFGVSDTSHSGYAHHQYGKMTEECFEYTFLGYFSKEKVSIDGNNLACVLVFPQFRGQHYGTLLIELSYEISKIEGKVGGPEKPLSVQGFYAYKMYWRSAILSYLLEKLDSGTTSVFGIQEMSVDLGISIQDILFTLQDIGLVKYWYLGKNVMCVTRQEIVDIIQKLKFKFKKRLENSGVVYCNINKVN